MNQLKVHVKYDHYLTSKRVKVKPVTPVHYVTHRPLVQNQKQESNKVLKKSILLGHSCSVIEMCASDLLLMHRIILEIERSLMICATYQLR